MKPISPDSPTMRRIVAALVAHGPMSPEEIVLEACVAERTLTSGQYLKILHDAARIHVHKWDRSHNGRPTAIWAAGPGKDAKRPKPYSVAEKCRRWRKASNYNRRHADARRILTTWSKEKI
jgi:hypothetical protein